MTITDIRTVLSRLLPADIEVDRLADDADLFDAGMTSFMAAQAMLGLEEAFDITFPDELIRRETFASLAAIKAAVETAQAA